MDFDLDPGQLALRERIRKLAQTTGADTGFPEGAYRSAAESGVLGHCLPAPYGAGGGLLDLALINEWLAWHAPIVAGPVFVNQICGALIAIAGNAEQKERFLGPLARGECRFAFALTEPEAGSDAGGIRMQAQATDDGYRLSGEKLYATGSRDAAFIITAARSRGEGKASQGTSLFLVPRDAPGLNLRPLDKIAGNDYASVEAEYREVPVDGALRLGPEHGGWPLLAAAGGVERIGVAASCVGTVSAALEDVRDFVRERRQFGQAIADFQAVRHRLADLSARAEAMRWLTYRAAVEAQRSGPAAAGWVSRAKLFACESAGEILLAVMKLHGGRAYLREHPAERRLREGMLAFYAGGTAEIQRELVARDFLA